MTAFADLSHLRGLANHLEKQVKRGRAVVVTAPTGAGRWTLADTLVRDVLGARAVDVRLPPFEAHDAALHGLYQVAASLGATALEIAEDAATPLSARVEMIANRVAEAGRVLVIHVPESWWIMPVPPNASRRRREQRARELLEGLLRNAPAIALLHNRSWDLLSGIELNEHPLKGPRLDALSLRDPKRWGAYAGALLKVAAAPGASELSPIQVRLLVGLAALGEDPAELVPVLGGGGRIVPLVDRLSELMQRPEWQQVADAVRRFLRARFPLPRDTALHVADCPQAHVPLLTECIAYEQDSGLRVPDAVRARLRGNARTACYPDAHEKLAAYHKTLDGAPAAPAERDQIVNWLERAHHLGRCGEAGKAEWGSMKLSPEQLLDRAWSLSVEHEDFRGAAELYEQYLKSQPEDPYAWHYLGFNRDRARAPRADVELAYRQAIAFDKSNPWWNSRLVTFLIRDLRYDAADEEWRRALERIDPSESRIESDPWLARHVHRWVAKEWLEHGEVDRATRVFRLVPRHIMLDDRVLRELEQRLEDAREATQLGESVYPAHFPVHKRWTAPRVLVELKDDQPRKSWMPGRVAFADSAHVTFVVAQPGDKRVFKRSVTQDEWRNWSGSTARVDSFFEIGFYGESAELIEVREVPDISDADDLAMLWDDDEEAAPVSAAGA